MTDNDSTCAPSSTPGCSFTPNVEEFFVHIDDEIQDEEMEQEPQIDSNQELGGDEDDHPFKRARKSEVWKDVEDPIKINGEWKTQYPRLKMKVVEITFPHMFPSNLVREKINKVKDTLYELYDEYKALYPPLEQHHGESRSGAPLVVQGGSLPGMSRVLQVVRSGIRVEPRKSELDVYLEECTATDEGHRFDALNWWKERARKFVVLSRLAADVLAIPITTVASEATFSAGSRVIDPYRSSLLPETVQMLICTGDWCRSTFGIKRKNKVRLNYFLLFYV
ncbi:hypothetical protein BVRB_2g038210 [Beta vulgaris subsp. vulgaris]|nr:hypothetical protein BVRB_2g038210 [Beta vulgaris subsp. vulgaris]